MRYYVVRAGGRPYRIECRTRSEARALVDIHRASGFMSWIETDWTERKQHEEED